LAVFSTGTEQGTARLIYRAFNVFAPPFGLPTRCAACAVVLAQRFFYATPRVFCFLAPVRPQFARRPILRACFCIRPVSLLFWRGEAFLGIARLSFPVLVSLLGKCSPSRLSFLVRLLTTIEKYFHSLAGSAGKRVPVAQLTRLCGQGIQINRAVDIRARVDRGGRITGFCLRPAAGRIPSLAALPTLF
jgi:hypothetical protein